MISTIDFAQSLTDNLSKSIMVILSAPLLFNENISFSNSLYTEGFLDK